MIVWLAISGYAAAVLGLLTVYGVTAGHPIFMASQISLFVALVVLCGFAHPQLRAVHGGFARFCDALGGGHTRERIERILHDPRPGVFAVVGLTLVALLQLLLLGELLWDWSSRLETSVTIACAQLLPGLCAIVHCRALPKAPGELLSRQTSHWQLSGAVLICTPAWALWYIWQPSSALLALLLPGLYTLWFHSLVRKRLGYATEASMAALVQIGRLLVLLAAAADLTRLPGALRL